MKLIYRISLLWIITLVCSCTTKQKVDDINYVQNLEEIGEQASAKYSSPTIQPGDKLSILITAKDMDVVKPFNRQYSSSENISTASGNAPAKSAGPSSVLYLVDADGNIDFNVIGQLSTTGKTILEFKQELRSKLMRYIKDPTIDMSIANFTITVLGEVNNKGEFTLPMEKATIVNAIAKAGDLTIYGVRDDVTVIRTEDGQVTHGTINLLDANFIHSPYYNLKQGDAIIVKSNDVKQKIARQDPNRGVIFTIISIGLTALALAVSLTK